MNQGSEEFKVASHEDLCQHENPELHQMLESQTSLDDKEEIQYKIKEDDSLFGLALKYDLNVNAIKDWNNLSSETIYPGQTIILHVPKRKNSFEFKSTIDNKSLLEMDSFLIHEKNQVMEEYLQNFSFLNWEELLSGDTDQPVMENEALKVQCYYCTSYGNIIGELTIERNMIYFYPDSLSLENKQKIPNKKSFIKFQASIDSKDLLGIDIIDISPKQDHTEMHLQILLFSIGDCKNPIYAKKVKEFKHKNKPMASVFFKLFFSEEILKLENLKDLIKKKLQGFFTQEKDMMDSKERISFTRVPFYDIISGKEFDLKKLILQKSLQITNEKIKEVEEENEIVPEERDKIQISTKSKKEVTKPRTQDESTILSDYQFFQLVENIPPILNLCNWVLSYATVIHGTSFEVLFRLLGNLKVPNLLVLRDYDKNVFGAFFSEGWKRKELFYGTGETFLFTFKTTQELTRYKWTEQNNYFLLTNGESGICIGAGEYYGLYIHPDLTKGYSYPSETFNNDFLTDKKDFFIERLEVWTVDYEAY